MDDFISHGSAWPKQVYGHDVTIAVHGAFIRLSCPSMFGRYDLKNLFSAPTPTREGQHHGFEALRVRVADTLAKIKQAITDTSAHQSYRPVAPRADAINESAHKLLVTLHNLQNTNRTPTVQQTLALSRGLWPLFGVWDKTAPTLGHQWSACKSTLGQVRLLVESQELKLYDALVTARKSAPVGSERRQNIQQALEDLSGTAVSLSVRRRAMRQGISPAATARVDSLTPSQALDAAVRAVSDQLAKTAPNRALGRPERGGVAAGGNAHQAARAPVHPQLARAPTKARPLQRAPRVAVTHRGPIPLVNFESIRSGKKIRANKVDYAHLNLKHAKYNTLQSVSGAEWTITSTLQQGGSGKFHRALAADGKEVGSKELRLTPKQGVSASKPFATRPTAPRDILKEARDAMRFRGDIEKYSAQFDQPQNEDSLLASRTETMPFRIYDIIEVPREGGRLSKQQPPGKVHMIMTAYSGSIYDLMTKLQGGNQQQQAGVSLMAQAFTELGIMHDVSGAMHRDIHPGNLFFYKSGQMGIMDFGLNLPTNGKGESQSNSLAGSVFAPEMAQMLLPSGSVRKTASQAQDVFCLGISVAEVVGGPNVHNPFYLRNIKGRPGSQEYALNVQILAQAFQRWRAEHQGLDGKIDPAQVTDQRRWNRDPMGFSPFFSGLAKGDPGLFNLVMNQATEPDPSKRMRASQLAKQARALQPPPGSRKSNKLLAEVMRAHQGMKIDALMDEAKTFRAWESQTRDSRNAPRYKRGETRPLP